MKMIGRFDKNDVVFPRFELCCLKFRNESGSKAHQATIANGISTVDSTSATGARASVPVTQPMLKRIRVKSRCYNNRNKLKRLLSLMVVDSDNPHTELAWSPVWLFG